MKMQLDRNPSWLLASMACLALATPIPAVAVAEPAQGLAHLDGMPRMIVFAPDLTLSADQTRRPSGGAARSRPSGAGASRNVSRPATSASGRPTVRGGASSNINHNANVNANRNLSANRNVNVNQNVNVNRNVNVNNNYHGGGWDDDWDDHWHPVATAAAVAVTAAAIGSIVRSVPPSCSTVVVNGIGYSQCGSTWYQPQYVGTSVQYIVVNPPR